ncbi:MED15 [Trypoxylus dichotomus]
MADDWRTTAFRQSVVTKIDEAIRQSGQTTSRNSHEMENHVFQKAKTKEEYLGFVARLILHVREMTSQGSRNNQMMGGLAQPGQMGGPQQMTSATNLLQTLNRGPSSTMVNMQGNIAGNMTTLQGTIQPRPTIGLPPNSGPISNQMAGQVANQISGQIPNTSMAQIANQMTNQMQNTLANQLQGQVANQLSGQITTQLTNQINQGIPSNIGGSMSGQIPPQMTSQMQSQMLGQMQSIQRKPGESMMMNAPNANFPRNPTPTQFLSQSPSPSVQSPAGMGGPQTTNQMVASPALAPSPSSQMNIMGGQRSVGMAPSPSSSLNTPGQPNQSPMAMQDEQAYREKVRQLSKFIEPLRRMIQKMGNDGEHVEKTAKMKKLLEILSNPTQRMPLETLLKCEVVLKKMDFKRGDGSISTTTSHLTFKEHHVFNPLVEAVSTNIHSPVINHTLHRTFGPTLEALFGPEIKLVPPLKKMKVEEPTSEIPDVLQGEIARLDQRFKVSLDPNQQPGSKTIQLICWLDDKHLPCVPPVLLIVPEDYPLTAPKCNMAAHEYNTTQFLSAVQTALLSRVKKLPKHFSVSQLLDTWEMSVRQASAPSQSPIQPSMLLMGL